MLDEVALAETGQSWGLTDRDLSSALDPRAIVASRVGIGGAAPQAVEAMIAQCEQLAAELEGAVDSRQQNLDRAEQLLLAQARTTAGIAEDQ